MSKSHIAARLTAACSAMIVAAVVGMWFIPFVSPAQTVMEIGPGFGRWTAFLKDSAGELLLADVSRKCLDACRERFGTTGKIHYLLTDGRSLVLTPRFSPTVFAVSKITPKPRSSKAWRTCLPSSITRRK